MSRKRTLARIVGTAACALSIGFIMQRGESGASPVRTLAPEPVDESVLKPATKAARDKSVSLVPSSPELPVLGPETILRVSSMSVLPLPSMPVEETAAAIVCTIDTAAEPVALANVSLTVDAPCLKNERVTVHHNGMMFTETTDDNGQLAVTVPALSEAAVFVLDFSGREGAVAQAVVPDFDKVERIVLQWAGDNGFEIHAREAGADDSQGGHVWFGSDERAQSGGSVVQLGDPDTLAPRIAQVYTLAGIGQDQARSVALSVKAKVNDGNCGQKIAAQSLEMRKTRGLHTRDLVLTLPGCEAVGDFLVLNNLFDDLTIAAR